MKFKKVEPQTFECSTSDVRPFGCMELWAGNERAQRSLELAGLEADIIAVPSGAVTALRYPATAPATPFTLVLGHGAGAPQTSDFDIVDIGRQKAALCLDSQFVGLPYPSLDRRVPSFGDWVNPTAD